MLIVAAAWVLFASLYLLLVGQFSLDEIALAVACGLVGAAWFTALRAVAETRFRFEAAALGAAARALLQIPLAVAKVAAAIACGAGSVFAEQPFQHGKDLDADDAGRRAVVLLAVSVAPDKFALRFPENEDALELHAMPRAPERGDARWPA